MIVESFNVHLLNFKSAITDKANWIKKKKEITQKTIVIFFYEQCIYTFLNSSTKTNDNSGAADN